MKKYDIFISYRREGGYQTADSIYQRLVNAGYSVFLDLEQLNSGKFNEKLLKVIDGCQDFIMVLPPNALDRCINEDDWVRKEVEFAIKAGKNIIPVMLKGFEWPYEDKLPESLKELPNFNGISATDHNVFTENIERLKNHFLTSKRGITWRSHKTAIISATTLICIILGAGIILYRADYNRYTDTCTTLAAKMLRQFTTMHYNVGIAGNILEEWTSFKDDYTDYYAEELRYDFSKAIDFYTGKLKSEEEFKLTDNEKRIMKRHGIPTEELEAVPIVVDLMDDEIMNFIENARLISEQTPNKYMDKTIRNSYESLILGLEIDCYGFMSLFSMMPEKTGEMVGEAYKTWTLLPSIPLNQTLEAYELMQQTGLNRLNDLIGRMGGNIEEMRQNVEALEHKSKLMEKEVQEFVADQKIQSIEDKKVAVEKRKADLAEMDMKLIEIYNQVLEKFKLLPNDDQGTMWGKILRIAHMAQIELEAEIEDEKQHKELVEAAENAGLSSDSITKRYRTLTSKDKYANVDKWLRQYQEYNPAGESYVDEYINPARAYYKSVAARKLDPTVGVLLTSTKDNEPHPVYKIGDIIIEKNSLPVHNFEDYRHRQDVETTRVKVLRLIDGSLKELSLNYDTLLPESLSL